MKKQLTKQHILVHSIFLWSIKHKVFYFFLAYLILLFRFHKCLYVDNFLALKIPPDVYSTSRGIFSIVLFYRLVQIYFIAFYFIDLLNCQNQLSVILLLYCNKYYACDCKKCYTYECKPNDWCACIACIYAI